MTKIFAASYKGAAQYRASLSPPVKSQLKTALLALLGAAIVGCSKQATPVTASVPPLAPTVLRSAVPSDHKFDMDSGFVATDLAHGRGAAHLEVNRAWRGSSTLSSHFGSGWSDPNLVRLGLVTKDLLLIWRGGVGSDSAHRTGDKSFETDDGEKIAQAESGWTLSRRDGSVLTFSTDGRLVSEKPAAGATRKYDYDKSGRLNSLGTSAENTLRYSYDGAGRVTSIDGPEKLRITYHYNDKGRLASVVSTRKVQVDYRYADDGALLGAVDRFGNQLDLANAKARLLPSEKPATSALTAAPESRYQFDEKGRVKGKSEGGETASYQFDQEGRLTTISSGRGRTSCKYDAFGRISEMQNADGSSTRFEYNNLDQPTLIASADGTSEKRSYNDQGVLVRRENSPTAWEELSYDNSGRLELRRRPPAAEEHYTYGEGDRIARIKYSNGREVNYEYDPAGRIQNESWSSGEKRSWRYDADGRLAETVAPAGLRTTYTYDGRGQLVATEDSTHGKSTNRRTRNLDMIESAAGKTSIMTTEWGKPLETVQPGGARTAFRPMRAGYSS